MYQNRVIVPSCDIFVNNNLYFVDYLYMEKNMKKKILSALIMCFLAFSVVLTGCKDRGLDDNPDKNALTISNGGMTVVKDDYLYFVNGFVDETSIEKEDLTSKKYDAGNVTRGAIYRTKLDDAEISKDKDGFLNNADLVVSRVVGFESGGFYIIGNTIYYATPYLMLDGSTPLSDRVEFRSININGDTKTDKQLYVTDTHQDNLDWTVYRVDGNDYIVTYVNGVIYSIDASNGEVVGEIESVTSYAFYHEEDYNTTKSRDDNKYKYVYYTREASTSDNAPSGYTGNALCAMDVTNGKSSNPLNDIRNDANRSATFKIVSIIDDNLYYTKTVDSFTYLYKHNMNLAWDGNAQDLTDGVPYTSYYPTGIGDYIIASDSEGTYLVNHGAKRVEISTESLTILNVYGGYAYYLNSDVLYRFKVTDPISTQEMAVSENATVKVTSKAYIDFDNQRLYVYAEYDGEYYLNYVETTSDGLSQRFVGVFADGEKPEEPEQDENYGKEGYEDIEYIPWID